MKLLDEKNYVDKAEKAILKLKSKKDKRDKLIPMVTTSKIRNLLAMTMDIYNELVNSSADIDDDLRGRINYLRVRVIYEAGREQKVKDFVTESEIVDILKEVETKKDFILFSRYMESLVAFHRFNGGKD